MPDAVIALPQLQWVRVDKLYPAPWNPPRRTSERNLRELVASMREHGFILEEAIQVTKGDIMGSDGQILHKNVLVVADGNRRFAASKLVPFDKIPAFVMDMDAQEWWALKNGTVRPPSVRETGEAVAHGLRAIPPSHARVLHNLLEAYDNDWDKVAELMKRGQTPSVINAAQRISNYCGMRGDGEFLALTIEWLANHHASLTSSRAISDRIRPDTLLRKVLDNQPLINRYE